LELTVIKTTTTSYRIFEPKITIKVIAKLLMSSAALRNILIVLCMLSITRAAMAQDSVCPNTQSLNVPVNPGRSLEVGTSQLGFWVGYSLNNPTLIGRSTDRSFSELNLQYARVLKTRDDWALKYTVEIVPVAIMRQPRQGVTINGNPVDLPGSKQKVYGGGISPIGLQMNFRRGCVLQPYVSGTAGILYFEDQVPVGDSSKFNFELGLGAGVEIWHQANQSIRLGYMYHHISNGYTARHNPGVDSNLIYVGYAWSWSR
jgi:opacity protein-like surface antigen